MLPDARAALGWWCGDSGLSAYRADERPGGRADIKRYSRGLGQLAAER